MVVARERCPLAVPDTPKDDVALLEHEVSLEGLAVARGISLKRKGHVLAGTCPFHRRSRPTFTIDARANTWACPSCKTTRGTVVDFVMRTEGISRRHAVELLQTDHGVGGPAKIVKQSTVTKLPGAFTANAGDAALLAQVVAYYHDSLGRNPQTLAWLKTHGVTGEAVQRFQVGLCDRTLGYRIPKANRKGGAEMRGRLQALGVLRDTGHEMLRGCVTLPLPSANGVVVGVYGRRLDDRAVDDPHVYVGRHGVWNQQALTASREIVVCSTVFDALIMWSCGVRNVTSIHRLDGGELDGMLDAISANGTSKVTLLFPRTPQGDRAVSNIKDRLKGVEVFKALLPTDMNVEQFVSSAEPQALLNLVRAAEWIGGVRPRTIPKPALPRTVVEGSSESAASPPSTRADEIVIEHGDRRWRVLGLSVNTSYERLRVHLFVSRETGEPRTSGFFVDTVELYSARQRSSFVEQAADELGLDRDVVKRDLGHVLLVLEARQDEAIRAALETKPTTPPMTEPEKTAALDLLRDPHLLDRILSDFDRCGVVGEDDNKLVGYLAATSRKLRQPLAVMIQSSSAAGKSSLMEAVIDFVPPEDRFSFSAMTPQSIFYMGETDIGHKVLSIAEQQGAERAAYALKVLQSEGRLSIASTGKEPGTGRLVSHEYSVQGPVAIFTTTTSIDVDEELLSRCIVLTVDERPEQTRAIHDRQRHAQTLDGLFARGGREHVLHLHRNAQRLLRPLGVVNPFATELTFPDHRVRARRDHRKYLGIIEALALLHQYQRPVKTAERDGLTVEYVEVGKQDVAVADRLAAAVVSRGLDDLPPTTQGVLARLDLMVRETAGRRDLEPVDVRFTRREVRERLGLGATQAWTHLRRLIEGEYLVVHPSRRGRGVVYELALEPAPTTPDSGAAAPCSGVRSGDVRPPKESPLPEKQAAKPHRSVSARSQDRPPRPRSRRTSSPTNGAGR